MMGFANGQWRGAPVKFNLKTAEAFGLTLPLSHLGALIDVAAHQVPQERNALT
jgi:hypothetical protein